MARTITIDGVQLQQATIFREHDGTVRVEAIYDLLSGTTVIQTVSREIAVALTASQKTALAAALDQIRDTVRALEL